MSGPAHVRRDGRRDLELLPVVVVLPALLVLLEVIATGTDVRVLLFPPLSAIGYLLFRHPDGPVGQWRSAVVGPTLASVAGVGLSDAGGLQAWTVAVAGLAGVAIIATRRPSWPWSCWRRSSAGRTGAIPWRSSPRRRSPSSRT